MKTAFTMLQRVSRIFTDIGGVALTFMMCLTVADVVLRSFDRPILGAYEMVGLSLAIVIGFSMPKVSLDRGQVYMEILLEKLPRQHRDILNTFTRILCIILFAVIGWNLFLVGNEFHSTGEVSATLRIPFFPVAYCIAVCCFVECLVFIFDIVNIWRGQYE
jgi:TRAP-type C4-dicarboxylate transport system permease small subunit